MYNAAKTAAAFGKVPKLLLEVVPRLLPIWILLAKMLLGLQLLRFGLGLLLKIDSRDTTK